MGKVYDPVRRFLSFLHSLNGVVAGLRIGAIRSAPTIVRTVAQEVMIYPRTVTQTVHVPSFRDLNGAPEGQDFGRSILTLNTDFHCRDAAEYRGDHTLGPAAHTM